MKPYLVTLKHPVINALFYSEPGYGKTTLAASCQDHPAMKNVLFANIEGGMLSIAHRRDIHGVDITNFADLEALFWKIAQEESEFRSVNTIVIDNISELQRVDLDDIVMGEMDKTTKSGNTREDRDDYWQEDYGKSTNRLERVFRWFKNLPVNVIFTAHAKYVYPKTARGVNPTDLEPTVVIPKLTQSLCKGLMGLVDFIWYIEYDAEEDKRYILTRPDGIIQAKTRGKHFASRLGGKHGYREITEGKFMMPEIYDMLQASKKSVRVTKRIAKKRVVKKKTTKRS